MHIGLIIPWLLFEGGKTQRSLKQFDLDELFDHRPLLDVRLDVTSSNFPKFDRNPNTGEEPLAATEFRAVRQTVHHSRRHPSRVEITILNGEER